MSRCGSKMSTRTLGESKGGDGRRVVYSFYLRDAVEGKPVTKFTRTWSLIRPFYECYCEASNRYRDWWVMCFITHQSLATASLTLYACQLASTIVGHSTQN